ncbi:hypothetical protein VCHENC01_1963 [Vibrio harveyi]|nr:hypothetical protein VCHENC01_1963 [Vibrio harveyi]
MQQQGINKLASECVLTYGLKILQNTECVLEGRNPFNISTDFMVILVG